MIAFLMLAAVQAETEPVMAASARAPVLGSGPMDSTFEASKWRRYRGWAGAAGSIKTTSGSGAADWAACAYLKQKFFIDPPKSGSNDVEPVAVRNISAALEVAGKP